MFEPVRGGTRGGQAEFKWSDVSADKDRENYLGHSINAPTGRWQKNKDIHWYNRDAEQSQAEKDEEIRKIKELEADALAVALGFEPTSKTVNQVERSSNSLAATGSNSIAIPKSETADHQKALEKEERRRRKTERKEEKRARKELKRIGRSGKHDLDDLESEGRRTAARRSRSRSPRRHLRERSRDRRDFTSQRPRSRSQSRTPPRESHIARQSKADLDYDQLERERERERDRRRWDLNTRREVPPDRRR